jgi:RNA polymerase sigma-70 factor (ECF subfamily)
MGVLVSHTVLLQPPDGASDAQLVARAIDGDRWGREMLYRRHAAYLLAIAARLLGNRNEGEEVVQDTFVTAFEQLPTLREPAALRGWLAQIAVSLVRRRMRRGRLLRALGLDRGADDATLGALAAPGTKPDQRAELALIDKAMRGMAANVRIAWMLRMVEGLELAEVASACGCSLATAKRRIAAAEQTVRAHIGPSDVEPDDEASP